MTRREGDTIIIEEEPDGKCELCGKEDELRPYGPNKEYICYECGMKDPETTGKRCIERLFGLEADTLH